MCYLFQLLPKQEIMRSNPLIGMLPCFLLIISVISIFFLDVCLPNAHTHTYTHTHTHTHAYTDTRTHAYTQTVVHTCTYIRTCTHTYMYCHQPPHNYAQYINTTHTTQIRTYTLHLHHKHYARCICTTDTNTTHALKYKRLYTHYHHHSHHHTEQGCKICLCTLENGQVGIEKHHQCMLQVMTCPWELYCIFKLVSQ